MLKLLGVLLLTSLMAPVTANFNVASFENSQNVVSLEVNTKEEVQTTQYSYTEEESEYATVRTYDTHVMTPEIVKSFCAPAGYVFTLSMSDWQINEVIDQLETMEIAKEYINIQFKYLMFGTEVSVFSDSIFLEEDSDVRALVTSFLKTNVPDITLFKAQEILQSVEKYLKKVII